MQKHVKIYLDFYDLGPEDNWTCEACTKQDHIQNFEIHHINGRGKDKDVIGNLICLCRRCHNRAHSDKNYVSKSDFAYIHNSFLSGQRKAFLK